MVWGISEAIIMLGKEEKVEQPNRSPNSLNPFVLSTAKRGGKNSLWCWNSGGGKKRSLCKIQSNFSHCDKILLKNVQFCPDSPAADTFISKETLSHVKFYLLSWALVVPKLTGDRQHGQPKDEWSLRHSRASGRFGGPSVLPLCTAFQSLRSAVLPLSVSTLDQILKREKNI